MRLVVTGGAGFIGSNYVRWLLGPASPVSSGVSITVLDSLTYAGGADNLPRDNDSLTLVKGDVRDAELLHDLLPGHDAVVHFAAESHVDRSILSGAEFASTNVVGTQAVLQASVHAGIAKVVHVSTDEVYGPLAAGSADERSPLLPSSPYAASKAGADLLARAYWYTHGLNVSVTRCTNNYGPRQHVEKLIPRFVTNLLTGQSVPLYGDGRNTREWLHVDDHCRAIQLVLTGGRPGEVYNVGGGTELSNIELTRRLLSLCGAGEDMIAYVEDRKGHDLRYSVDDRKLRDELGYTATVPLERGLAEVVAWYRDNPDWWQRRKTRKP
jgi:dTDP-glucose 4,6-dehydratase